MQQKYGKCYNVAIDTLHSYPVAEHIGRETFVHKDPRQTDLKIHISE